MYRLMIIISMHPVHDDPWISFLTGTLLMHVQDYSPFGYHGKAVGSPSFTGSYMALTSALAQHVVLPQSFCNHVLTAASFSSSCWVYLTAVRRHEC
jgi:hypothetical protein